MKLKGKRFSKILVAIDGSEQSMKAAEYAIVTSKKYNADLVALHVLPEPIKYWYSYPYFMTDNAMPGIHIAQNNLIEIIELSKQKVEGWFDKIRENSKANNVKLDTEIITSSKSVVAEIVDYAEGHYVDLIIIGTKGASGFKKLLLGSVASGVVTYAHCPIMVVK